MEFMLSSLWGFYLCWRQKGLNPSESNLFTTVSPLLVLMSQWLSCFDSIVIITHVVILTGWFYICYCCCILNSLRSECSFWSSVNHCSCASCYVFQSSGVTLASLPATVAPSSVSPCPGNAMAGQPVKTRVMKWTAPVSEFHSCELNFHRHQLHYCTCPNWYNITINSHFNLEYKHLRGQIRSIDAWFTHYFWGYI